MRHCFYNQKPLVFLALCITSVIVLLFLSSSATTKPKAEIGCYRRKNLSLPSILKSNPPKNRSIFFIETSCFSESIGKIVLTSRQACAIESAAKMNPNFDIYVLMISSGTIKYEGTESDRFLQAVLSYENVKFRHLDLEEYFKGTIVENLWKSGKIEGSDYVYSHTSDVLRYLTMWRYGGIYLDLDIIVLKSLEDLPLNYISIESKQLVGSTVMSFSSDNHGRHLAQICLDDLSQNFNGSWWEYNGPGTATRLGKTLCNVDTVPELFNKTCENFTFYSTQVFLPIPWSNWSVLFDNKYLGELDKIIEGSHTVHIWNNLNRNSKTRIDVAVPHTVLGQKFCPKVFTECDLYF